MAIVDHCTGIITRGQHNMEQIVFTPAALLDLLVNIDELKDVDVGITEDSTGNIKLSIGDSTYEIDASNAVEVQVSDDVVDAVETANDDTYSDLDSEGSVTLTDGEPIESGIIKEALKSLLLGGLIRLSAKLIK